jgi:type IV pilus assembly protein PilC
MPRYSYRVRDAGGRLSSGTMSAVDREEVAERLAQKNLEPVSVEEVNFDGTRKEETFSEKFRSGFKTFSTKVPLKTVVFFTRQLTTMLHAGVPISDALTELAQDEKPVFKKIVLEIEEDVSAGKSFSDALARHPGAFTPTFVAVIRSGEASGALVKVLDQMAIYLENVEILKQKIKSAMRYPMFISIFVLLMMIGILWKLVPVFSSMYANFNAELPAPTRVLVAVSDVVKNNILIVALLLILIIVGLKAALTRPSFRFFVDRNIFKLPVYGIILKKNILARFCRTLSLLMESGTPILQAVEITSAVVNNKSYAAELETVYDKLRNGEPLSKALKETGLFPRLVTQLTATGEKSGRIDELLVKAAEFYEREIKTTVDAIASVIEPLLIIVLGGIIGSILITLYLPVFNLGKLLH